MIVIINLKKIMIILKTFTVFHKYKKPHKLIIIKYLIKVQVYLKFKINLFVMKLVLIKTKL